MESEEVRSGWSGAVNVVPKGNRRSRSVRKDRAAEGLALGMTQRDAAAYAGAGERTVRRWLDDPEFVAMVRELRRREFERTSGRLMAAQEAAIDPLVDLA